MKTYLIEKQNLRRKDCSISRGAGPFTSRQPRIGGFPYVLPGCWVDSYLPGVVSRMTLNFGNSNVLGILKSLNTFWQ